MVLNWETNLAIPLIYKRRIVLNKKLNFKPSIACIVYSAFIALSAFILTLIEERAKESARTFEVTYGSVWTALILGALLLAGGFIIIYMSSRCERNKGTRLLELFTILLPSLFLFAFPLIAMRFYAYFSDILTRNLYQLFLTKSVIFIAPGSVLLSGYIYCELKEFFSSRKREARS
jgi:hypothetical protein